MTTHTPGPWKVDGTEIVGASGTLSAKVICHASYGHVSPAPAFDYLNPKHDHDRLTVEANATLIAAAPDLLAACRLAEAAMTVQPRNAQRMNAALEAIGKAIAKATGGAV